MSNKLAGKFATACAIASLSLGSAHAADLTVEVGNVAKSSGRVLVALFNRAEGFPRKDYWRGESLVPVPGTMKVVFRNIPEGIYAVTAYHDVDGNKKLNTNGLGIPVEPLAFSNNAAPAIDGPPKFSAASFKVSGASMKVSLTLK